MFAFPLALIAALVAPPSRSTVMIELTAEPAAVVYARERSYAAKGAVAVNQIVRIDEQQAPVLAALPDGAFRYSMSRAANAIVAELDDDDIARIAAMPNVKRVVPMAPLTLDLTGSVPLVGAPVVWAQAGGHRGDGVRIGIIDTGVDYLHVDLGGPGVYSRTNFTTADVPWNAKVVGGTDLAGDDYDAGSPTVSKRSPHPDPDPMDCNGHGSHVAGIAAGRGEQIDGSAFTGPYGATLDAGAFRIGPGVAPGAQIYAIRVFGCTGSTLLVAQALDWALDPNRDGNLSDHLDVVNMSLGSSFGPNGDPAAMLASDNAAKAGMIVVASAGNSGDVHMITGSPAAATRVISVASSVDNSEVFDGFVITAPASIAATELGTGAKNFVWTGLTSPVSGTVVYPSSQPNGCAAFNGSNAALIAGKIALLDWTDNECGSAVRVQNAFAAGAAGVLLAYNNHPRIDITIAGSKEIPALLTTQAIADRIKAAASPAIRFDATLLNSQRVIEEANTDLLSDFSSRGPRSGDSLLKPDITAPGQSVFSVLARSGNGGVAENGTSMSSPMVAGGMALLRQIHPDWSVEEMKALVMNGAMHDLFSGTSRTPPVYLPTRIGAGRMSVAGASTLDLIAYAADNPGSVGVSFGMVEVPGQISVERQFRIVNKSSSAASVSLAFTPSPIVPGVSFDFPSGATLSVPANSSAIARLRLNADASQMKHQRDATSLAKQGNYSRDWLTEAGGYVVITRGQETLRLPAAGTVRPSSAMSSGLGTIAINGISGHTTIPLNGRSVSTGTSFPNDWASLVSPFELHEIHSRNFAVPGYENLRYAGVTSDYRMQSGAIAGTMIYFGVAAFEPWSTPNELIVEVLIDTNGDNLDDYALYNTNGGDFLVQGGANDVLIAAVCPLPFPSLPSNKCSSQWLNGYDGATLDVAPYNTDVMRLPVAASSLGLKAGQSRFSYRVAIFDRATGRRTDLTPRFTFDPAHSLGLYGTVQSGMFFDRPGNTIPVDWSDGDLSNNSKGLLLFHFFNGTGTRAEAIPTFVQRRHGVGR
jgi:subtilisin family serine protease